MISVRCNKTLAVFDLCAGFSFAQQLQVSHQQYLDFLKRAQGTNTSQKVDWLTQSGVTLSAQGQRDLEAAANPTAPRRPYLTSPAQPSYPYTAPPLPYIPSVPSQPSVPQPPAIPNFSTPNSTQPSRSSYHLGDSLTGTSMTFDNQTFHTVSDGSFGNTMRFGNQSSTNWSGGLGGTTNRFGNQTFTNWNDGSTSNSMKFGNQTFHNFNDGTFGTTQRSGNQTFTNFSNGKHCTSNTIGNQTFFLSLDGAESPTVTKAILAADRRRTQHWPFTPGRCVHRISRQQSVVSWFDGPGDPY
jgi:hypothetical protein